MAALSGLARETRQEPAANPPRPGGGAMDWSDVRVFLAVAREGSMRAAGRALGLSQPTIARRLAAFETSFGGQILFDRLPEGLRLNAVGEQLVAAAEGVEEAVLTLERRRAAASPELSGTVRVSTGECAAGFLARCLSGPTTIALPSGITLELVDSRQTANLARREADMALRHQPPETGDFYISKAGTFACAVYRRGGADAGAWVTYTEEQAHYEPARWVQRQIKETGQPVALRASSMLMHFGSDLRRHWPRGIALLCWRRASAARAFDPADPRNRGPILDHRSPRSAPLSMCARSNRLDEEAVCRAAGGARWDRIGSDMQRTPSERRQLSSDRGASLAPP
jgi:DNA-binding transcriptional LysR family regulator